ncbi:hypothetical protein MATL_G00203800 [Megalops atlanticus]|uniref:Signal recognition particle 9 kDa protein n=1 Tax=Megalops atlanticus TaxID=7932 RepID=A0A9D3PIJ0_MEGAT|nr:hypothetical protein MATL_G00203800 [Megalops atlanticus]
MPYYQAWDEFSRAAEKLYLTDPMKVRVVLKYRHCDGNLCMKVTDDAVCLQYKTDQAQDVKKIEKLHVVCPSHTSEDEEGAWENLWKIMTMMKMV